MAILTYNPKEIQAYLTSLGHVEAGGCTEIRILPKENYLMINGKREYVGSTVAGYYTDYEKAARDIAPFDGKSAIYATLNACDPKLMRRASNKLAFRVKATAKDEDIISILWFPFDVDPVRPADTPSSDAELSAALDRRDRIIREVFEPHGVPVIRGMSGNGGHGLIPLIGYPNIPETQAKIKRLLDWLSETYTDETVSVDTTVGNPSRLWKVYGTLAVKGDNTPDAPYRRAFIELPETVERFDGMAIMDQIVPSGFQSTATSSTKPKASTASDGEYPRLDVNRYLAHHNIEAKQREKGADVVWRMDCPFNSDHKNDAQLRQEANGRMGFACPHNSCKGRNWQDFREMFDPTDFFERTGGPRTSKRQREYSGLPGSDPGASTIDAPGHKRYENPQPETDEENQDAQEKARRAQRVKSFGEKAKQRLRQGLDPKRILEDLKAQRDQWGDLAISDEVIEKLLTAEIQAFMPKTLNGAELMQKQFPEPKWILKGFIPSGVTVLASRPKMGKTAFALNVALAVASGGIALSAIECDPGEVLYCCGITEGSFPEMQDRCRKIMAGESVSPKLHVMEDLSRLDDGGEAQLRLWLTVHPETRLIILDTLQSFMPRRKRAQSDGYSEGYDVMTTLQRIAKAFDTAILLNTHTRKEGVNPEWVLDEVLGSTALTGAVDTILVLRKKGTELCTFGRRIPTEEYSVTFDGRNQLWTLNGMAEAPVSDQRQAILTLLEQADGQPLSPKDVSDLLGRPYNVINQLMWGMKNDGQILAKRKGQYVLPVPANEKKSETKKTKKRGNDGNDGNDGNVGNDGNDTQKLPQLPTASMSGNDSAPHDDKPSSDFITTLPSLPQDDGNESLPEKSHSPDSNGHAIASRNPYGDFLYRFGDGELFSLADAVSCAQAAGFDMTAEDRAPKANVEHIIKHLREKPLGWVSDQKTGLVIFWTIVGDSERGYRVMRYDDTAEGKATGGGSFYLRDLDALVRSEKIREWRDVYQLNPAPKPAEQVSEGIPEAHVDFILAWYAKCGNHPAYQTTLLHIAKKIFPVKMGLSVSDQMDAAITALEGKVVCGLSIRKDESGLHLEGMPDSEVKS